MSEMPIGPRRINILRRVSLPARYASALGVVAGSWVVIRTDRRDSGVLLITASPGDGGAYAVRDVRRPRRVSATGQLSLPATLLDGAGLAAGSWVALGRTHGALRVFSADRVRGPDRDPG
jgi:bifunctional DNA-binding transcriptional regulator/antitoxin component of YhaV-PrlF toxin-antitoxin module